MPPLAARPVRVVRRLTLLILLFSLAAAPAAGAASGLGAERQRSHAVLAQVAAINSRLAIVVQRWDGARVRLSSLQGSLRANEMVLRISRANLTAAQKQLEQRLYDLYVQPAPGALDVFAGSTSIGDLIDRLEAQHSVTTQDLAIAGEAQRLHRSVARREALLRADRRRLVRTIASLDAQRTAISGSLAREQRLLASIHESIHQLTAAAAAAQERRAAAERASIARRVAAAKAQAAAAAITTVQSPAIAQDPAPSTPPSTTTAPAPAPAPAPGATPPASPGHPEAATIAAHYLGVPYVWGGESPAGFDCSGLVSYVYAQLGISLPHYTVSQWDATMPIAASDLEPGDLVFFDGLGHVGIYIGGGEFIDAPRPGAVVQVDTLAGYWSANFDGARRVP